MVDHLEHGLQNADDGAVGAVHAFVEPAQPVEVTEELVGAVDEVHDHFGFRSNFSGKLAFRSRCRIRRCIATSCLYAYLDSRVRRSLLRGFELCECSESVIVVRLTADPMTFLRAILQLGSGSNVRLSVSSATISGS